ncbi:MAG: flagellar motor switch protein FliG [Treponema sp.]|jgi:flagellar motor switch protein FliG|nr:flagellar motor switch protein FliG [Treponema sp.]
MAQPTSFKPEDLAGFFEKGPPLDFIKTAPESRYRKVAKFLILIGKEAAAQILSKLEPDQVEAVSKELVTIRGISEEESKSLLDEFRSLTALSGGYKGAFSGGVGEARSLLYAAFGPEKGESILKRTVPAAADKPFVFLEEFSAGQLEILFKDESPATEAMVLSRLPPKLAAEVIKNTEPGRKVEIIKRIAKIGKIAPSVLEAVASALKKKVQKIGKNETEEIDGMSALTAILKAADVPFEEKLLDELAQEDVMLSYSLRAALYTLDDVVKADDRVIEEKLRGMSEKEIVYLIKGQSRPFIEKIMSNISTQRRAVIREESDMIGPIPRIDADTVAADFLTWFRRGREKGTIMLMDDEDVIR